MPGTWGHLEPVQWGKRIRCPKVSELELPAAWFVFFSAIFEKRLGSGSGM